jgi:hypothetical protein
MLTKKINMKPTLQQAYQRERQDNQSV